jgi:hypothetical protein
VRNQQQREVDQPPDCGEVAQRVVGQLAVDVRIDGERAGGSRGDGVTVGRGILQHFKADDGVGAGAVFNDDLLAHAL